MGTDHHRVVVQDQCLGFSSQQNKWRVGDAVGVIHSIASSFPLSYAALVPWGRDSITATTVPKSRLSRVYRSLAPLELGPVLQLVRQLGLHLRCPFRPRAPVGEINVALPVYRGAVFPHQPEHMVDRLRRIHRPPGCGRRQSERAWWRRSWAIGMHGGFALAAELRGGRESRPHDRVWTWVPGARRGGFGSHSHLWAGLWVAAEPRQLSNYFNAA